VTAVVPGSNHGDVLASVLAAPASALGDALNNYGVPSDVGSPLAALDAARMREQLRVAAVPAWGSPRLTHARLAADVKAVSDIPDAAMNDAACLLAYLATHFEGTRDAIRVAQRISADPAMASAADAADARARRLRAGVTALTSRDVNAKSSRVGIGKGGAGDAYAHETDMRLAAMAEGWRAAASRRGHQFTARLRWLPMSMAGRRLHRVALAAAAAAVADLALPLLVTTQSQLEAELERLCRHFALDAGLTRHSLAAHVRRLFVDVFAAQEARARPTPCRGSDPGTVAAQAATTHEHGSPSGHAQPPASNVPRWGSPGNYRERIFLLDPPVEPGEIRAIDADAMLRAAMTVADGREGLSSNSGGQGRGAGGNDDGGGGRDGRDDDRVGASGGGPGANAGGFVGSSSSGAGVWSPEDEYWPTGIDCGGGSAAASGEREAWGGGRSFSSDAILAAAAVDQTLEVEARTLKWSDGYRAAARMAAAARSATLADADGDVTYAAARAAADAAVRAVDPDLSPEAAADATAEAVKPFLPAGMRNADMRRKVKVSAGGFGGFPTSDGDEECLDGHDPHIDVLDERMLRGHDNDGTSGFDGRSSAASSYASEGLATAGLLRYVRTRGMRERILHARNHAASVRSRLAADRRYHEAPADAARAPPPEVDTYEARGGSSSRCSTRVQP